MCDSPVDERGIGWLNVAGETRSARQPRTALHVPTGITAKGSSTCFAQSPELSERYARPSHSARFGTSGALATSWVADCRFPGGGLCDRGGLHVRLVGIRERP
jgi:hypothetical protein